MVIKPAVAAPVALPRCGLRFFHQTLGFVEPPTQRCSLLDVPFDAYQILAVNTVHVQLARRCRVIVYTVAKISGVSGRYNQTSKLVPANQYLFRKLGQRAKHLIATYSIPDFFEHLTGGNMIVNLILLHIPPTRPLGNIELTKTPCLRKRVQVMSELVGCEYNGVAVWFGKTKVGKDRLKAMGRAASKARIYLVGIDGLNHAPIRAALRPKLVSLYDKKSFTKLQPCRLIEYRESSRQHCNNSGLYISEPRIYKFPITLLGLYSLLFAPNLCCSWMAKSQDILDL